jgi:4-aminobutyrate aminotransferase-like enzyme
MPTRGGSPKVFVNFPVLGAAQVVAALLARGVRMGAMGPRTIRAVNPLDVTRPQIERALEAAASALIEATP